MWVAQDGGDLDHRFRDSEEGTNKLIPSSYAPFAASHYTSTLEGATIDGVALTSMTDAMKRTDLDTNRAANKVAKVQGAYSYILLDSEFSDEAYDAVGKRRTQPDPAERLEVYQGIEDAFGCRQVTVIPHPLTAAWVDTYRNLMRDALTATIGNDLNAFYTQVIQSDTFNGESGLKGSLFEHWLATHYAEYNAARIFIPINIKSDPRTKIIADGFAGGSLDDVSGLLYDAKAYSPDSGPDVNSMAGYEAAIGVPALKKAA